MTQRQISEIVKHQEPVILGPEGTVQDACRLMRAHRVGAVLVADGDRRLLGIFTGRDAVCRVLAERRDPGATRVAEVMTRNPDVMAPDETAFNALLMMHNGGFRHLPVVEHGRVVGIVSRVDFRAQEHERLETRTDLSERLR